MVTIVQGGTIILEPKDIKAIVRAAVLKCVSDLDFKDYSTARAIFDSPEAKTVKREIIAVGKKLWLREYVDGNGGNISFRISKDYVLCTPTLCSKADLTPASISLVNFENKKIMGASDHTSELLLHLEIYKAVPSANAVIHCHPPHATAYAITGSVPLGDIIPEQEVFIGPVATAPYETPGTKSFAETILPFVRSHNSILLENHGIVCWADTVTHAEWYVEILENYCRTLILASQLDGPIRRLAPEKIAALLAIKQRLRLPDARLPAPKNEPDRSVFVTDSVVAAVRPRDRTSRRRDRGLEDLVRHITAEVIRFASNKRR